GTRSFLQIASGAKTRIESIHVTIRYGVEIHLAGEGPMAEVTELVKEPEPVRLLCEAPDSGPQTLPCPTLVGYAWPMALARTLTLVGLLASGVTAWIHQAGVATMKMCRPLTPTTCERVIVSQHGAVLGVPLPVVGLAGFGLILGLSLYPRGRAAF